MKIFKDTWEKVGDIHHAYVLTHGAEGTPHELAGFLKKLVAPKQPDVRVLIVDTLGIDEVRQLRKDQSLSSVDMKQFFIIKSRSLTTEAQNALLKVFEEPTSDTHFFLCVDENILLPTLRSRVVVVSPEQVTPTHQADAQAFFKSTFPQKLQLLRALADAKDHYKIEELLNGLERELSSKIGKNKNALKTIIMTRRYLRQKGANSKLLLENMALSFS